MSTVSLPPQLPLFFLQNYLILPGSTVKISIKNSNNKNVVESLLQKGITKSSIVGTIALKKIKTQKSISSKINLNETASQNEYIPSNDHQASGLFHNIGTAALVVDVEKSVWLDEDVVVLTALCRFEIKTVTKTSPFYIADVNQLDRLGNGVIGIENGDMAQKFREKVKVLVQLLQVPVGNQFKIARLMDKIPTEHLTDICASIIKTSFNEKLSLLEAVDCKARLEKILPLLERQIKEVKSIASRNERYDDGFKLMFKRRPAEEDDDDFAVLEDKIRDAKMPEKVERVVMRDLNKMRKMSTISPETAILRNYLELLVELPWNKSSRDTIDINKAREDFDAEHYGMKRVKERLIEFLAVQKVKNIHSKSLQTNKEKDDETVAKSDERGCADGLVKAPLLCLVGPPGVGKTSIAKSVADTLGRKFCRISLGGVSDQSEIRGHRRTYIASMPGKIIQGLKRSAVNNPVILLDEVDKMSKGPHGDPAAALLEVLDPEQNHAFIDHFVNVPFDLSRVLFIATANSLTPIPPALKDRMEVVHITGYTPNEKLHIAQRHLLPKQAARHGILLGTHVLIPDHILQLIINKYTKEAGVRGLEKKVAALLRNVALKLAENDDQRGGGDGMIEGINEEIKEGINEEIKEGINEEIKEGINEEIKEGITETKWKLPIMIGEREVEEILGASKNSSSIIERISSIGVALGLAWTAYGGEVLCVEARMLEGKGRLVMTGQLGDVMKESASVALAWLNTHAAKFGIKGYDALKTDFHIHFPAAATNKDGPSAGITIATALASLVTNRKVRRDTAMTGELTLTGVVLPVGGIKEKILAAHRENIKRVIVPYDSRQQLNDVPQHELSDLEVILVKRVEEVLMETLDRSSDNHTLSCKL